MITVNEKMALLAQVISMKADLGKTAVMKIMYILQKVYKLPLDYSFSIYTYGPYCSDVMADIDTASAENIISIKTNYYTNGKIGYDISTSENSSKVIKDSSDFLNKYKDEIAEVLYCFGDKTAKELELYSTVIYIYNSYIENQWEFTIRDISENVHEIKPHFSIAEIENAYNDLKDRAILDKIA